MKIQHKFVDFIPDKLKNRILYISIAYSTVVHKCCCGCGEEVVTPLSPTDWKIIYDGKAISLYPSIGNWSFLCQSHYWIRDNKVIWAPKWSKRQIEEGRLRDTSSKKFYFDTIEPLKKNYKQTRKK